MGRERKIEVGALNIKTHPHSPEQYSELFKDAYELELAGKIRGSFYGIIGHMQPIKSDPVNGLRVLLKTNATC